MENDKRTAGPVTKAATSGGVVAGAITVIGVWVASLLGVDVPEVVAGAFTVLIGAGGALLGGWLVRPGTGKRVDE